MLHRLLCIIIIIFPVSELEADDGVVSVDVSSSCYSSVVCSMGPIDECTAYCGASGNIEDLTNSGSSSELVDGVITIRLPPATGTSYHCVVTGSRGGSIVFRGRQQQTVSGKTNCRQSCIITYLCIYIHFMYVVIVCICCFLLQDVQCVICC